MISALFKDMSIGKRLGFGYGCILLLIAILVGISLYTLSSLNSQLDRIVKVNNSKIRFANDVLGDVNNIMLSVAKIAASKDLTTKAEEKKNIEASRAAYRKAMEDLEKLEINDEGKNLIAKAKETIGSTKDANNKAIELAVAGKSAEALLVFEKDIMPFSQKMHEAIDAVVQYQTKRSLFRYEEGEKSVFVARIVLLLVGLIEIVLCIVFGLLISRSITKPVAESVGFAKSMAEGDLTQTINIDQKDEVGVLVGALNNTSSNLRKMFGDISSGVQTLSSASTELAAISKQMSVGSEQTSGKANSVATAAEEMSANMSSVAAAMEQASTNVNTVASATEQMTATIGEIARNSENARVVTDRAVNQANTVTDQVTKLGNAAKEIGKITEVITSISAQTNLLALNATIEAARAGAAGKGFAVVANEIKGLAQQTAAATEDIKSKIEGIQDSTIGAVADIEKISKVIQDVNDIVSTIAAAIEEQTVATKDIANNIAQASQGIQEVTQNVAQSTMVTNTIAQDIAGVNQSAGEISSSSSQVQISAEELSRLAEQLSQMVGRFKV